MKKNGLESRASTGFYPGEQQQILQRGKRGKVQRRVHPKLKPLRIPTRPAGACGPGANWMDF